MSVTTSRSPALGATARRAVAKLIVTEAKLFVREPIGAFFTIAFPAVLVLVLGSSMPGFTEPSADLGGLRPIDIYLPITLALTIATVSMVTLLGVLAGYREKGILRRLSTTPVSPTALLAAQLVVNVVALLVGSVLAFVAGRLAFAVRAPVNVVGVLIAFVLGSAAMVAVALLVAAITPNSRASAGVGTLIYFPMMFFAGVYTPGPVMPDGVRRIADFTPLGAASQAMGDAWFGDWPRPLHLGVMLAMTALFGATAVRLFRWE